MLKHVLPSGQVDDDDDVDPGHHHQWVHRPVNPDIAYSAHGQPGAAVLILAEIVVLARERDTNVAQRTLAEVAVIYVSQSIVIEINAYPAKTQAVLVHIVQGVIVERDILELAAEAVSFK